MRHRVLRAVEPPGKSGLLRRRIIVEGACELEKDLVLEALQIGVTAKAEETRVSGPPSWRMNPCKSARTSPLG
jgi:hypothetical protein